MREWCGSPAGAYVGGGERRTPKNVRPLLFCLEVGGECLRADVALAFIGSDTFESILPYAGYEAK